MKSNFYYQAEKQYASIRLIVLFILTFFSLIIVEQVDAQLASKVFLVKVALVGTLLISMGHYLFILRKSTTFVIVRKILLILLDLAVVTFFIAIFEENGLFLLPLYLIIVMQNGLSFGIGYFYTSIILASISWILLLFYSSYWGEEHDIIATFAMTTFLIPLFYLKFIDKVHEKNDELSEILTTTEHDANHDALTGLANRKMYKEVMDATLKQKEFFSLLFIDLNKFKAINDTYGHDVGDEVLIEVSKRLQNNMSSEDFLARLGGDEFVIISRRKKIFLPKFLKKLEDTVIGDHTVNEVTVLIELSMGVSVYPDDIRGLTPNSGGVEMMLSKYADDAMYIAKKTPNTYHMLYSDIKS
ncbi:MAG: diguanylate cyclase [Campylobacterota bacterium]|nr:diguanylate cyclase [Campylobacterota bacterium]